MVFMLLTGSYFRTLDEKSRLAIPKRLRDAFGNPDSAIMYLAPGTDGSLALYTEDGFSLLGSQLGQGSPTGQDVQAFSRLFYSQAQLLELDKQGRMRVPTELAQYAGLHKDVVLLGVRDHLEIWDRAKWDEYLAAKQPHYDQIAESAFGGPGTNEFAVDGGPSRTVPAAELPSDSAKPKRHPR